LVVATHGKGKYRSTSDVAHLPDVLMESVLERMEMSTRIMIYTVQAYLFPPILCSFFPLCVTLASM
jgi:hypothetical protein